MSTKAMNTEEQAKEMVDKFQRVCGSFGNGIAAAIICCDEIIKELESVEFNYGLRDRAKETCLSKTVIPYYQRLKIEIKKL